MTGKREAAGGPAGPPLPDSHSAEAAADQRWRQEFALRHSELDFAGRLSIVGATRLLQESAGEHADALGLSPATLMKDGLTWVLAKFHVKLLTNAAVWRSRVRVETWRAGIHRLFAARDYRATLEDGTPLAEATSYWAMIDLKTRRPIAFPPAIRDNYPGDSERVALGAAGFTRVAAPERTDCELRHLVRLSELDLNEHVTNTAYSTWAVDSIPAARLREFSSTGKLPEHEIVFKAEALFGDTVLCRTEESAGGFEFKHQILRESDGRELALARTRFV